MSKRLSSILDSLAAVLVSRENKEVISVGFRLSPTNEIVLSIADNKPVGLNIETHARDLWHRIAKLSKRFRNYQKEHHMKFSENLQSEIRDVKYFIYFHSFRKFMSQFTKGKSLYAR